MAKKIKMKKAKKTFSKQQKLSPKSVLPADKVDFLIQLNKLAGSLLIQLKKEV